MKCLCATILFSLVLIPTLAAEMYYAVPIQQYVTGDQYDAYQNQEDNEVLTPDESSRFQGEPTSIENESSSFDNSQSDGTLVGPVSYSELDQGQGGREILQTDEAMNYYRPYLRYRQISKRRTRVPVSRRYDTFSRYSALSGYASQRDRFPTVA